MAKTMTADGARVTASAEDYLEAILRLLGRKSAARVKDIACELSLHKSTVSLTLKGLAEKGLIEYSPYELVQLTSAGRAIAEDVTRNHETILVFLRDVLLVDEETAGRNACRMEHVMDRDVLKRLRLFVGQVRAKAPGAPDAHEAPAAAASEVAGAGTGAGGPKRFGGQHRGECCPLGRLNAGDTGIVRSIAGAQACAQRLAEMGILPGLGFRVLRAKGPVILDMRGHRLLIGSGVVNQIIVEKQPWQEPRG